MRRGEAGEEFGYTEGMVNAPGSKPRWYRLTPDRFLLALLALELFLLLSQWFCWFPFNEHNGWTVLVALATLAAAVLFMLIWFRVNVAYRRRFQFSVRSLFVFVLICAGLCSWLAVEVKRAREQRDAVEAIRG